MQLIYESWSYPKSIRMQNGWQWQLADVLHFLGNPFLAYLRNASSFLVNRLRYSHRTIWIFQQLLNADFRVKCSLFRGCWRISTVGACAQSTCFYILHSSCHLVVATSWLVAGCKLQLLQLLLQLVGFELGIGIFIFTFVGNNGLLTDRLAAFRWAISSITFRYL